MINTSVSVACYKRYGISTRCTSPLITHTFTTSMNGWNILFHARTSHISSMGPRQALSKCADYYFFKRDATSPRDPDLTYKSNTETHTFYQHQPNDTLTRLVALHHPCSTVHITHGTLQYY